MTAIQRRLRSSNTTRTLVPAMQPSVEPDDVVYAFYRTFETIALCGTEIYNHIDDVMMGVASELQRYKDCAMCFPPIPRRIEHPDRKHTLQTILNWWVEEPRPKEPFSIRGMVEIYLAIDFILHTAANKSRYAAGVGIIECVLQDILSKRKKLRFAYQDVRTAVNDLRVGINHSSADQWTRARLPRSQGEVMKLSLKNLAFCVDIYEALMKE